MARILLMYPPGPLYQRGEDRCQGNIDDSSATSMRACNDLGYGAAVLLRDGHEVLIRDYQTEKKTESDVFDDLQYFRPDMIMVSVTNATIYKDIEIVNAMRTHTNAIMVLKGAIFYAPERKMLDLLDFSNVDFLIGGEVDTCIDKIALNCFNSQSDFDTIDNICYKDEKGYMHINRFHIWENDLDSLPFPARDYMNNGLYVRPDTGTPMATIQTSRGCPAGCIYCLSPEISGRKVRYRSTDNVLKELTECYEKYNIKDFFFKADTFTIDEKWVMELCTKIIQSPLYKKIHFSANSRVNPLKKETLEIMKKAGCFTIAFGFESGSEESLENMKKGATLTQNKMAMDWAKEVGLPVYGFYLIGLPWETWDDLAATKALIFEQDADFIEVHIALPYYGTLLYDMCKENGLLEDNVYGSDYFHSATKGTNTISMNELIKFRKKIMLQFYLRPVYIFRKIKYCITQPYVFGNYIKYGFRLIFNLFR